MNNIAIVAVAYNRVDSLSRLLSSLEKANYGNERPTLIISIDKSNTNIVEKFADDYHWPFGEKVVRKHIHNLGLRAHMMSLGEWFERYEVLIVLEDDIIVAPDFYNFTRQASDLYYGKECIAGLSLYSFAMNYQTGIPFTPARSEYDVYLMNCAMSWGEVWMKPQWQAFYDWYLSHQNFHQENHLPERICNWKKSWLKYHTRYCIESNKYFIHPYVALSSNFGDAGTHNDGVKINCYQVVMQMGAKKYLFPEHLSDLVKYDGFFENKALYKKLGLTEEEVCIDICGMKRNRESRRYWLTTSILDYKILKSYGLSYRPIEMNILFDYPGSTIFLYDTTVVQRNTVASNNDVFLYYRYQQDSLSFINSYGRRLVIKEWFKKLTLFIKRHVSK